MKRIGRYCYERVRCWTGKPVAKKWAAKKRAAKKRPAKKRAKKRPAKKRPAKKRAKKRAASAGTTVPGAVVPRRRGTTQPRPLSRSEFARAVERGAIEAPAWHPGSDKSLIRDVYEAAALELPGVSFDAFKARLRAERFPMDRIDLVELLTPQRREQNDFFGLGPYAIRKRVRLA